MLLKILLLEFLETLKVLELFIVVIALLGTLVVVKSVHLGVHSSQESTVLNFSFLELLALKIVLIGV